MGLITRICKATLLLVCAGVSTAVSAKTEDALTQYASARLAEIGNDNDQALKGYLKLYRSAPDSGVLADRIFDSAIRSGDMATALRAVRAQELRGEVSNEAPLLLFADAFRRENWPMALLAVEELSARSNFVFAAPILRSWVNIARRVPADLPSADQQSDPLFAYYSSDQRIYMALATGNFSAAKLELRALAGAEGGFARDVMLRAVPVIAASGDEMFADALIGTAMGVDRLAVARLPLPAKHMARLTPAEGLAALHTRLSSALLEQKLTSQALVLARIAFWYAPDNDPAQLALADALSAEGHELAASEILGTIAPASYYWPQAIQRRADALAPDEALALVRDASRKWPDASSLKLLEAQSFAAVGDAAEATISYRKLADKADQGGYTPRQRAFYRMLLATSLDDAGDWPAARRELDAALLIDPSNAQVLNYLGYSMLERQEDMPRASELVRKAFEQMPDSVAITDSMGWAHLQAGNVTEAVPLLEKAAKSSGNDPVINEHLGDAYWLTGRFRDARYAWRVAAQAAEGDEAMRLSSKIDFGLPGDASQR